MGNIFNIAVYIFAFIGLLTVLGIIGIMVMVAFDKNTEDFNDNYDDYNDDKELDDDEDNDGF